ncbi:MAG: hypothetical protein QXZ48_08930 [Zestosphaera sp.]
MCLEKEVLIRFTFKDFMWVASLAILLGVSLYVIYVDYNTTYTWVYPLDRARLAGEWYPKSTVGVGIIDLRGNMTLLTVYRGFSTSVILDEYSSGYALIVARGFNLYVLTLTIFSVVFYVLISRLLKKKTGLLCTLLLLVFFFVVLASVASLIPYVSAGSGLGYVYRSSKIVRELNSLNFTSLKEPFLNVLGYAYLFRDSFEGVTLVNTKLEVKNSLALMVLNRSGVPEVTYNTAFYEVAGKQLLIYLFSSSPNPTGSFTYVKIEFMPRSTYPQTILFAVPLILSLTTLILGLVSVFVTRRLRSLR